MIIYPELELSLLLQKELKRMGFNDAADLQYQENSKFGNLSSAVAMKVAKRSHSTPEEIAKKIISNIKLPKSVSGVEVVKPGFINFTLSDAFVKGVVGRGIDLPVRKYAKQQKIIVEYSSPNIAKPFGVGHLRSTIIGDAVANAYEALGNKVIRINHIGDWGTQFGKLIYAYLKWGSGTTLEENPIKEMLELYVRFHTEAEIDPAIESKARYWFKKLEDGDEKATALWHKFSSWSMKEFEKMYNILGVQFDEYKGESQYIAGSHAVLDELHRKGISSESEGATIVKFDDGTVPALLVKQDGASLYMTRDIVALKHRLLDMKADKVIYHVGSEQALHFKQLFVIAEYAKWADPEQMIYAPHGLMRLPEGKMSTRKGRIIILEKLVEEAVDRAYKVIEKKNPTMTKEQKEKVAYAVGVGAIKYNDLQNHRQTSVTFDWDKMLSFEGNSAPYIQYTYARLRAVARKAEARAGLGDTLNELERTIGNKIIQFPSVIDKAANNQAPNILAEYAYQLAGIMSTYYEKYPIIKSEPQVRRHRLAVIAAGADTLKKSMMILGIETPEEI